MRRGFSSTEVLISAGILAFAIVPVVTLFSSGTRQQSFTEQHLAAQLAAMHVADRVIEIVNDRGFDEVDRMPQDQALPLPTSYTLEPGFPPPGADVKLTNLGGGLVAITVGVEWAFGTESARHVYVLDRLLSRPEIGLVADYPLRQTGVR